MEQVSNGIESVVKCIFKLESSGSWGHRFRRKANTHTLDAAVDDRVTSRARWPSHSVSSISPSPLQPASAHLTPEPQAP